MLVVTSVDALARAPARKHPARGGRWARMGREAALGPVGEGARAGGKLAWPAWRAQLAHQMKGRGERVRHARPDKLTGASRAPLYDAFILFSIPSSEGLGEIRV